ncbi:hypothetical protein CDAR_171651 [Caerostris darwini]|uniref:Uncharacterized protein n=1 Tax=Caerostris darwini TaxID=1538125 RepID=A0AAV4WLI3_9ARAC|nr:hypothetical protein CDAR_171651 [Caerostris darwini]
MLYNTLQLCYCLSCGIIILVSTLPRIGKPSFERGLSCRNLQTAIVAYIFMLVFQLIDTAKLPTRDICPNNRRRFIFRHFHYNDSECRKQGNLEIPFGYIGDLKLVFKNLCLKVL